jgi:NAD(P)-dependent dehydrogenase (short-subunit alcohol dehydrogenase family)
LSIEQSLAGQIALVTGAARGIGLAIAERYAREGAHVIVADVAGDAARDAAAEIRRGGGGAEAAELDVRDAEATEALVGAIERRHGRLDIAVANAGILRLAPVQELPIEAFTDTIDINLVGVYLTMRSAAQSMIRSGGGRIIATSSVLGVRGMATNAAYSAAKFGVLGLVQAAAVDLAPHGIRVNAVCPGQIDTQMLRDTAVQRAEADGVAPAVIARGLESRIPQGRIGTTEEIADAYVFLAGKLSVYVTGQHLIVDGGWTLT